MSSKLDYPPLLPASDASLKMKRKKLGGNKKERYTEGWVEFAKKSIAKRVAMSLNNTPVGGKKRGFNASDLWNMKYLSKFKWADLTEQMGAAWPVSFVTVPLTPCLGSMCDCVRPLLVHA